MKTLALETVDMAASVALMEAGETVREVTLAEGQRSAQFLTPAVMRVLAEAGWRPADVALVALPVGPGSFTGLRVGVTFAKTFAYVTGAAVIGLNTLDVLAESVPQGCGKVVAAMDAQRGDVITRTYALRDGRRVPCDEMRLVAFDAWLAGLAEMSAVEEIAVTGPILAKKQAFLPPGAVCVPEECRRISPVVVGRMARERFLAGQSDSIWDLLPIYARRSAAEERRMEKMGEGE